ncbi:MAG: branched-chain amino acid ABC transporter permease [Proteobacteria bacterium]|nr:branched-chain amino acid ABC transporter permease [Pseudomonadota bacterium]
MLQGLANGIILGALFALLGVGLTVVYGVMDIPNFAQAGVITLGAYIMLWCNQTLMLNFWVAALAGILTTGVISVLTERVAYRFVRTRPLAAPVVALGLLLVLDNSALDLWGGAHVSLSPPYGAFLVRLGPVMIPGVGLAVVVIAALALIALHLLLRYSRVGRAIRAVSQNPEAAAIVGIDLEMQYVVAFFISGILAGVTALAYAPTFAVYPYMADNIILNGFVVVILGGLGSVWGAVVAGLLLGIIESFAALYVSDAYQTMFGFAVLLAVIVLRPGGLFNTRSRRFA